MVFLSHLMPVVMSCLSVSKSYGGSEEARKHLADNCFEETQAVIFTKFPNRMSVECNKSNHFSVALFLDTLQRQLAD